MSFFSRKPNPPVPAPVSKLMDEFAPQTPPAPKNTGWLPAAKQQAVHAMNAGLTGAGNAAKAPQGKAESEQALSNARFRSFAERYLVERCRDWKEDEIDERAWEAILQARSIYNKVKEVGRTLGNDN